MRILICNWKDRLHPLSGGAEVYIDECAKRWATQGHAVTLLCAAVEGRPTVDTSAGYRIVRKGSRFGVYGAVKRFLRSEHDAFDVIVDVINTRPFFAHRYAGKTPVVALAFQVAREVWFNEMPLPVALAGRFVFEPMWLRRYRDVPALTISESSEESLRAYGFRNVSIVPVGVELPDGIQLPIAKAPAPTLAFCGRLVSMKRPDAVIAAFSAARDRLGEGAELHVIGSGPLEDELRRSAPAGVVIHGGVSQQDKFAILGRADALLTASVREGWGLVVSEAAAVGTPTISYDAPGLRDSVHAANGVVVEATVDAMAEAIVHSVPIFRSTPSDPMPFGGAASWDDVATDVLSHLQLHGKLSAAGELSVPTARLDFTVPKLAPPDASSRVGDAALIDLSATEEPALAGGATRS